MVAVRRFFPFGADGGGLFDEERAEYDLAVERLAELKHPGLRAVLTGGCDPVDGMPFVVTEWIEGRCLAEILEHGVFSPAATIKALDRALEISEALSAVLGEGALWVDTAPSLIIEDGGESHRGLTFSMCPVKWLGGEISRHNLLPVAELAEDLLGWRGMKVPDQAGQGLGLWLKWLRANAATLTVFQVRASLANFAGGPAPEPARTAARPPPQPGASPPPPEARELPQPALSLRPLVRPKKPSSKRPFVLVGVLCSGMALAAAGWWVTRQPWVSRVRWSLAATPPAPPLEALPPDAPPKPVPVPKPAAQTPAPAAPAAAGTQPPLAADTNRSGVFQSGDTQRIMQEKDHEVTVEGVLKNIRVTDSGKTLYLEFVETTKRDEVRGCVMTKNVAQDLSEQSLKPLLGKRIRITGVVRIMHHLKVKWPEVLLRDRKSIQEVK